MRKGGGKEGLVNRQRRKEIKVIPTLIHKLLQTIPELRVFALLPQSHSPAFTPSLLKWITTRCLITKVKTLSFPTKDKQQQLLRQNYQCTLITVKKQTNDYKRLMRSLRLYRSGFSNCCSLNKGVLLIIGFVLYSFEKFVVLFKRCDLLLDFFLKELNRTTCPFSWPRFRKVFGHIVSHLLFINSPRHQFKSIAHKSQWNLSTRYLKSKFPWPKLWERIQGLKNHFVKYEELCLLDKHLRRCCFKGFVLSLC